MAQTEAGLGISLVWFVAAVPAGFLLLTYHMIVCSPYCGASSRAGRGPTAATTA